MAGDLVEAGAWRGGAAIFMKGVLRHYGADRPSAPVDGATPAPPLQATDAHPVARRVLVADSFMGFPAPAAGDQVESRGWAQWNEHFAVEGGADSVRDTFRRYGLWDERVLILSGYFNETLPYAAQRGMLGLFARRAERQGGGQGGGSLPHDDGGEGSCLRHALRAMQSPLSHLSSARQARWR